MPGAPRAIPQFADEDGIGRILVDPDFVQQAPGFLQPRHGPEQDVDDGANPRLELDNVMITPHTAWYSEDSKRDIRSRAVTNVLDVLEGLECSNTVNRAGLQAAV